MTFDFGELYIAGRYRGSVSEATLDFIHRTGTVRIESVDAELEVLLYNAYLARKPAYPAELMLRPETRDAEEAMWLVERVTFEPIRNFDKLTGTIQREAPISWVRAAEVERVPPRV